MYTSFKKIHWALLICGLGIHGFKYPQMPNPRLEGLPDAAGRHWFASMKRKILPMASGRCSQVQGVCAHLPESWEGQPGKLLQCHLPPLSVEFGIRGRPGTDPRRFPKQSCLHSSSLFPFYSPWGKRRRRRRRVWGEELQRWQSVPHQVDKRCLARCPSGAEKSWVGCANLPVRCQTLPR